MTVPNTGTTAAPNNGKNLLIKYCFPFTDCISEIYNLHIDNAKSIDVTVSVNNLIEYSHNYSKASGCLLQTIEMNHF